MIGQTIERRPKTVTQAEAEAGTVTDPRTWTPERDKQAIEALESFQSAEQTKLDNIEAGAEVNTVDSVAGKTGVVTLDTDDVSEASNLYYTEGRVSANSDVSANTAHRNVSSGNPHSLDIDDVTPTTTKGDVIVENGANAVRLGVGTDGQQLEADSSEATGIKWVTPLRFFDFPYRATTNSQTPAPNSGRLIWNTVDQTAATELFLSTTTDAGSDIAELLELLAKEGVQVTIFDRSDVSLRITYTITADATDNTTYFTIPVSFEGNTTTFSNNSNLTVLFNTGLQTPEAFKEISQETDLVGDSLKVIRVNSAEDKLEPFDISLDDIDETATGKIFTDAERTKLGNLNDGYKGFFATPSALTTAFPTASNGDFATVGSTDTIWAWDGDTTAWVDTDSNSLGDMLKTTYDPTSINGDAFDMANMVESATEKIFSNTERTKLGDIELNATADQSNVEIETAYNAQVAAASQVEMETGTEAAIRRMSPLRVAQAIAALGGAHLGSFDANDALFPSSNPAVADSRNSHPILAFDDTIAENIIFNDAMPRHYREGDILIDIDWIAETATTGGVTWGVEIERNAPGGNDIDSDSFATQQTGNSTTNATSGIVTRTTITLTQAEADDIEARDSYRMRLQRVVGDGGDTMTDDAQILNVAVRQ